MSTRRLLREKTELAQPYVYFRGPGIEFLSLRSFRSQFAREVVAQANGWTDGSSGTPRPHAIVDAMDLFCDAPTSAAARRDALRTPAGHTIWKVTVHFRGDSDDLVRAMAARR